jgi:hypothetical protein
MALLQLYKSSFPGFFCRTNIQTFNIMKNYLSFYAVLVFVLLIAVMKTTADSVKEIDNDVFSQHWLDAAYEQYYSFDSPAANSLT